MKRVLSLVALSLFGLALGACGVEPGSEGDDELVVDDNAVDMAGTAEGKAIMPIQGYAAPTGQAGAVNITYHGGPIMGNGINVYLIWFGDFTGAGSPAEYKSLLSSFAGSIGGSQYYGINTAYTDSTGAHVLNSVTVAGSIDVGYQVGNKSSTRLTDANIQTIVSNAITSGKLPKDTNGLYFVLTSKDVTASSGFCTQYCGWHTHGTIGGSNIKYSFVGDPARCPTACQDQATGPNGSSGADGAASIFAHELEETASDPDLNAWYDSTGYENGDKCAWTFGTESTAGNGAAYNVTLGGKNWLIQQNWKPGGSGSCGMQ